MRLGPGLLYEGRTLQGARPKLADFCSATMAEFYSAVDTLSVVARILAFNHPFMFCGGKVAAPLAAGNAVIIKPQVQAPLSA